MAFFNFFKQQTIQSPTGGVFQAYSTPFGKIGKGNLALPFIRAYSNSETFVRFGNDNLYPQLINQMFHTSPLNGAIIKYKKNSVIGGGFTLESSIKSGMHKVAEYEFMRKNKFETLMGQLTQDIIMHERIAVLVCVKESKDEKGNTIYKVRLKRLPPEQTRINEEKTLVTVCKDWSTSIGRTFYPVRTGLFVGESVYYYEVADASGQDLYPLPSYLSAMNDAFLDGETSFLQKQNILQSIYPSAIFKLAMPSMTADQIAAFQDQVDRFAGAQSAGNVIAFMGNNKDQLPTVEPFPTQSNDKLFTETYERIDSNLSRAHGIDPLLLGIRVSGKLGSGNEIKTSFAIFEKNVVLPLKKIVEEVGNDLLEIGGIASVMKLNEYKIIDDLVIETTKQDTL